MTKIHPAPPVGSRYRFPPIFETPADLVVERILRQIAVSSDVLNEAKRRRDLVLRIAHDHEAANRTYVSGSIAHGTHNSPLGDADGGVVIDRRPRAFREFGPDAGPDARGPEAFYRSFAAFVEPRVRDAGYPRLTLDLTGNRAIKFEFNEPVELEDGGPVDPYVDLIVALRRDQEHRGLWIPNRRARWWDPANPERHTWLMTERDERALAVHRAQVVRLAKRAVKRDGARAAFGPVVCSWNLSALSLDLVTERRPIATALAAFLTDASNSIAVPLTNDPARVAGPIKLPDGVAQELAARRLAEFAEVVWAAVSSRSSAGAKAELGMLFEPEPELDEIRLREQGRFLAIPSITRSSSGTSQA
jgi:hypothetical protein